MGRAQAKQQFEHRRAGKGFTAYDLIMPLFLFVVGAAMPFSFARRAELGHSKSRMLFKLLRRTVILFILGMAVQGHLLDFNLAHASPIFEHAAGDRRRLSLRRHLDALRCRSGDRSPPRFS